MAGEILTLAPHLGHQALFGAVAAAGFGVLFNFGWRTLVVRGRGGGGAWRDRGRARDPGLFAAEPPILMVMEFAVPFRCADREILSDNRQAH
jgi:hypothetical protein